MELINRLLVNSTLQAIRRQNEFNFYQKRERKRERQEISRCKTGGLTFDTNMTPNNELLCRSRKSPKSETKLYEIGADILRALTRPDKF